MVQDAWCVLSAVVLCLGCAAAFGEGPPKRNDWYRHSILIIHCDNHSALLGKGQSVDDLVKALGTVPCDMIQVSAQSNGYATYPTEVGLNNPEAGGYDTLATFKEVTRRLNVKLCIYMSVDRRPMVIKDHPEWAYITADGKKSPGEPTVCQRPDKDRKGYLYEKFIPQILEIIRKYDPDGFWFDGDYVLTRPCWCERCLKTWKERTGRDAPRNDKSPDWKEWKDWHYAQYQEYRRIVADAIHSASPKAIYTSNWSWAWSPEPVPDFADTLSGDEWSVRQALGAVMRWGAQQKTPWDMMSYATPEGRSLVRKYSLQRTLQEGAITMSAGGVWFAWTFAGAMTPAGVATARFMSLFAQDRKPALGPSVSLSQVAVLDSETAWRKGGEAGLDGQVCSVARSLRESHYLADIVNEETYRAHLTPYQIVVMPSQKFIAPETLAELRPFVEQGGLLVLSGSSLRGDGDAEPAEAAALLGLTRTGSQEGKPAFLQLDQRRFVMGTWDIAPTEAQVVARFADGRPGLTLRPMGKGAVAYLAVARLLYPDHGLMAAVLRKLGRGPSYSVSGEAPVLCTLRRKPGQVVLHVADLSTRVNGALADVDSPAYTDWNPPLSNLQVSVPFPKEPSRAFAAPALTSLKTEYADGILKLTFNRVQTHAAAVLETDAEAPLPLLPADSAPTATKFHAESDRVGVIFADDFESSATGTRPEAPWVPEVKGETNILVTEETAAQGRKSLKFVDAENSSFWPFLHRSIGAFTQGRARLSFDLRVDPGAVCLMELRYEAKGAGPSVRFDGHGDIYASGKKLTQVAPGTWFHVEIEFELGTEKPAYQVSVQSQGRPASTFKDIPYATEWFFLCNSVYFIGDGNAPGTFYLDNVMLERLSAK